MDFATTSLEHANVGNGLVGIERVNFFCRGGAQMCGIDGRAQDQNS